VGRREKKVNDLDLVLVQMEETIWEGGRDGGREGGRGNSHLLMNPDQLGLIRLQLQLAHPNQILVDLGQSLLISMLQVLGEILQFLRDLLEGLCVVCRQADFLPELRRGVSAFGRFEQEVAMPFLFTDGGIPTVG